MGTAIYMEFHIPMPMSWSKKKKALMLGKPHQQRPDTDNICKGVMDSLLEEDCKVWHLEAKKYWAEEGHMLIENRG